MSEIASTAWKNSSRALQLQLYQKQIYHYKVAGIELEKYSTGHEIKSTMLKPDLPQHKPEPPLENQWKDTYNLSTLPFLHCAISIKDHFRQRWLVAVPELCIFLGQLHLL